MEEDIYEGYRIPAGATVIANMECVSLASFTHLSNLNLFSSYMLHDPETYPNPSVFDPTRFIPSEGKEVQLDPRIICFGFGRRSVIHAAYIVA